MDFTEEKKKEIEKAIVDKVISALEQNFITEEDLGHISTFVLEEIDKVETQDQLIDFLRRISAKWNMFSDMLVIESGELTKSNDKKLVTKIEGLAESGNLDEAIRLAKKATETVSAN